MALTINRPPNRLFVAAVVVVVFTTLLVWYKDAISFSNYKTIQVPSSLTTSSSTCTPIKPHLVGEKSLSDIRAMPQKRRRVAIASTFGYHFDVYLALGWTMQRVMKRPPSSSGIHDVGGSGDVVVYSPSEFKYGFDDVVEKLGLFNGEVKPSENLFDDLNKEVDGRKIDVVVLGTCEVDLRPGKDSWHERLMDIWDQRPADEKFMLVCIVHNGHDDYWHSQIKFWAQRGAIRFLPISQHVANTFKSIFLTIADSTSDHHLRLAGYEYLKLDTHVPILNLSASNDFWNLPKSQPATPNPADVDLDLAGIDSGIDAGAAYADTGVVPLSPGRRLSKAVIQGSFSSDRREYATVFSELIQSLEDDPSVWGYLPRKAGQDKFQVDPKANDPFYLYLLGSGGIEIPKELEEMVIVKKDLSYGEFYKLMQTMDICVPAFNPNGGYFKYQASSTMVMALQCNVPILSTHRLRTSYAYSDDDRVTVTRPAVMSEVSALRALRVGDMSRFWDMYKADTIIGAGDKKGLSLHAERIRGDLAKMMQEGWQRSDAGFREFREDLWKENERVVEKILRDL